MFVEIRCQTAEELRTFCRKRGTFCRKAGAAVRGGGGGGPLAVVLLASGPAATLKVSLWDSFLP